MANPKGNPNIAEYGKETRFGTERGCNPVEAAKLANDSIAATREVMNLIAGKLPPGEAADVFVDKLLAGDLTAWRLWFEYNASKPAQQIEADITQNIIQVSIEDD